MNNGSSHHTRTTKNSHIHPSVDTNESLDNISPYNSIDTNFYHHPSSTRTRTFSHDHTNSTSHDEKNDDPMGMYIAHLLNNGAFDLIKHSSHNQVNAKEAINPSDDDQKQNSIFPIFSINNFQKVQTMVLFLYYIIFNQESKHNPNQNDSKAKTTILYQFPYKIHQIKTLPTFAQSIQFTITTILLLSILISSITHIIVQHIIFYYLIVSLFTSSLLFNYKDFYVLFFHICPLRVQNIIVFCWNQVNEVVHRFNNVVLKAQEKENTGTIGIIIDYLWTQRRYQGRDQWVVEHSNNELEPRKSRRNDNNDKHNNGYIFLIHRDIPLTISNSNIIRNSNEQQQYHYSSYNLTSPSSSSSSSTWQCQNVNWDKLSSILQTQHNNKHNHPKKDMTLHQSTLDHLIATNYCYIMINGNGNDQNTHLNKGGGGEIGKSSKQLSKKKLKKLQSRRKALSINTNLDSNTNVHEYPCSSYQFANSDDNIQHNTQLSPILSSQSEDIGELFDPSKCGTPTGLTSVQSMDAIEIIRPNSIQRRDIVSHKMPTSPTLEKRSKMGLLTAGTKKNRTLIIRESGGNVHDYNDEELEKPHHQQKQNLDPDLTLNPSETLSNFDDMNSLSSDADVSFSSTSYTDENHSDQAIQLSGDNHSIKDDVKWLDVGAKIGRRILESEKLHQVITKSQMASNTSSSFSGAEDEKDFKVKESHDFTKAESPKNIAKPFHAMWTSPNVEYPSFDDAVSEDNSNSQETATRSAEVHEKVMIKPRSITRRTSMCSLSPKSSKKGKGLSKPLRGYGYGRSISLPTSPVRSRSVASRLSETNTSLSSSEAFLLAPRQFDANKYLPPSMAIRHGTKIDNISFVGKDDSNNHKLDITKFALKTDPIVDFTNNNKFQPETPRMKIRRRHPLLSGVRMVVPIYPAFVKKKLSHSPCYYQFATVISSKRINSSSPLSEEKDSDCLSITVLLDKSFLRSGKFAEMTLRILDTQRHMPRHSKFPIGACVATSFGIGVLVGWRAEDDCHIIRALWQKRGKGAAHAYLNRSALHEPIEAAVGFNVDTSYGNGKVVGYINGGKNFTDGKYVVMVKKSEGRINRVHMELSRTDVQHCLSSNFIPVVEQIREAAKYQMQVDHYESIKFQKFLEDESLLLNQTWRIFSEGFELFLSSFIKAVEEDENIDSEINNVLTSAIAFLEDFDLGGEQKTNKKYSPERVKRSVSESMRLHMKGPGMWIVDDLLGEVDCVTTPVDVKKNGEPQFGSDSYKKVYAFLNTTARTVAIAKSACTEKPNLKMALAIIHEVLIFIHNVIKVQQINMSKKSVDAWHKTLAEFTQVFGSINKRLQSIGNGIIQRLQEHGKVAKVRAICFADTLISDDLLMKYLDSGDWKKVLQQVENAVVSANILDRESCAQYHQIGLALYNTLAPRDERNQEAALRSGKKITLLAKVLKVLATPGRSILKLFTNDEVLELIERVLVRVFEMEKDASQVINIYSWNFRTLRHLRILNNMAISGVLWGRVLDAADEEFTWAVSRTPSATRDYVVPVSKLFSLGVARFHQLYQSEEHVSADWLDFLKEDEAIEIIQELDAALMLSLKNLCKDVKDMMQVLPYYSSIDEDILRLIDEVDLQKEIKEVGEAILDAERFPQYIREKSATAVSKFLDYLPKMSIPIERREIGDDWVVTCRGRNGKDLTLSSVNINKENLLCKVFGGENVLTPVFEDVKIENKLSMSSLVQDSKLSSDENGNVEVSILDHVSELIRNAQNHGCWDVEASGKTISKSPYVIGSSLEGLPLSEVLLCAIDLWENLEIDDDELLEIAIRDVSHQIQRQKKKLEDQNENLNDPLDSKWSEDIKEIRARHHKFTQRRSTSFDIDIRHSFSSESQHERRFDPKKDPTVLFLSMSQLTCCLNDFKYRLEPSKPMSMFDPVFEGIGTLSIKNASIKVRIECRKERIKKLGEEVTVPVLQLQELHVGLEQVNFGFKETGADWLLNKIVSNFTRGITNLVRDNMKEQISLSINEVLDHLNRYIEVNPDLMLKILGITIDDLEENIAWV